MQIYLTLHRAAQWLLDFPALWYLSEVQLICHFGAGRLGRALGLDSDRALG